MRDNGEVREDEVEKDVDREILKKTRLGIIRDMKGTLGDQKNLNT